MIDTGQYTESQTAYTLNSKPHWLEDYAVVDVRTRGRIIQKDLSYTQAAKLANSKPEYRVIKNSQI